MQRMLVRPTAVELTDGLDIVHIGGNPGDAVRFSRRESSVEASDTPQYVMIEDRHIANLAQWLIDRDTETTSDEDLAKQEFIVRNDTDIRLGAVAVKPVEIPDDDEIRQATGELAEAINEFLEASSALGLALGMDSRHRPKSQVDQRIEAGSLVVPEGFEPVLFAQHEPGKLFLFPERYGYLPNHSASQLGKWILEGTESLQTKSFWETL